MAGKSTDKKTKTVQGSRRDKQAARKAIESLLDQPLSDRSKSPSKSGKR